MNMPLEIFKISTGNLCHFVAMSTLTQFYKTFLKGLDNNELNTMIYCPMTISHINYKHIYIIYFYPSLLKINGCMGYMWIHACMGMHACMVVITQVITPRMYTYIYIYPLLITYTITTTLIDIGADLAQSFRGGAWDS